MPDVARQLSGCNVDHRVDGGAIRGLNGVRPGDACHQLCGEVQRLPAQIVSCSVQPTFLALLVTYWLYQYANHQNKYSIGRSLSPCKHGAEDELGGVDGGELAQRLKVAVGEVDEEAVVWFSGPTCGEGEERLHYALPRLLL